MFMCVYCIRTTYNNERRFIENYDAKTRERKREKKERDKEKERERDREIDFISPFTPSTIFIYLFIINIILKKKKRERAYLSPSKLADKVHQSLTLPHITRDRTRKVRMILLSSINIIIL